VSVHFFQVFHKPAPLFSCQKSGVQHVEFSIEVWTIFAAQITTGPLIAHGIPRLEDLQNTRYACSTGLQSGTLYSGSIPSICVSRRRHLKYLRRHCNRFLSVRNESRGTRNKESLRCHVKGIPSWNQCFY
jgi:hypothetical protein